MSAMNRIYDLVENLLEAAEKNEKTVSSIIENSVEEIEDMYKLNRSLSNTILNIDKKIEKEIKSQSQKIADEISNNLLVRFENANVWADEASKRYEKSAKWINLKVIFATSSILISIILGIFAINQYLVYEIKKHKNELSQLSLSSQIMCFNNQDEQISCEGIVNSEGTLKNGNSYNVLFK